MKGESEKRIIWIQEANEWFQLRDLSMISLDRPLILFLLKWLAISLFQVDDNLRALRLSRAWLGRESTGVGYTWHDEFLGPVDFFGSLSGSFLFCHRSSEDFSCDARTESQFGCYTREDLNQGADAKSTFVRPLTISVILISGSFDSARVSPLVVVLFQ